METTGTSLETAPGPGGDRAFHIEVYGVAPIPQADLHGSARELFWIWFTANMALVSAVYGALLSLFGLNFWQSVAVLAVGTIGSFALVGVLASLSIIAAGTGITWVNAGADYTRYLARNTRPRAILGWTISGALLPILVVALVGFLLAGRVPGLASSAIPIAAVGRVLPAWMALPYLATAMIGLLAGAIDTIYSSGLSLLAAGIRLPRYRAVLVDGALMLVGAVSTMFLAQGFINTFESFLEVVSPALTAWAAIFLVDMRRWRGVYPAAESSPGGPRPHRGEVQWRAVVAWLVGLVLGLLFTVSPLFTGPLARGFLASGSFGYVISFFASLVAYVFSLRVLPATLASEQAREQVRP